MSIVSLKGKAEIKSKAKFQGTDRYQALGIPYPDPAIMCKGQCEGLGVVPVSKEQANDSEGNWHDLWLEAEKQVPSLDGYHIVICPRCQGTGKEPK